MNVKFCWITSDGVSNYFLQFYCAFSMFQAHWLVWGQSVVPYRRVLEGVKKNEVEDKELSSTNLSEVRFLYVYDLTKGYRVISSRRVISVIGYL